MDDKSIVIEQDMLDTMYDDNAEGVETKKSAPHEWSRIARIVQKIVTNLDEDSLLNAVIENAIEITNAERGLLVLLDEYGNLNFRAARGIEVQEIADAKKSDIRKTIEMAIEDREPVHEKNIQRKGSKARKNEPVNREIASAMAVPIVTKDRLIGVTYVDTITENGAFNEKNLVNLVTFVNLAAVAIENAQLFRNLTQTSQDYRTLREYHEKILSGLPLGEVVVSPNRTLEYLNQFAMKLWNLKPGEGLGKQFDSLFPIENGAKEKILSLWKKHQNEGVEVEGEVILDDKTYQVSFFDVQWWDHQETHSGLLLLDVSLQKLFDSELLNSDKRETVVQLAGGIAHEVNNLLLTITGRAELLQFRIGQIAGELSNNIGGDFKVIFNQAKKLQKVVEDLRRLSKPSTPKFVPTNVGQCLSTAVEVLSSTSGRIKRFNTKNPNASFYLNMDIEPDLPFIDGDPQSLEQMFINLIINAADAIRSKKKGKLLLKVFKASKKIIAKVEDTGIGIPANSIDKVFEPYFSTKGQKLGTGLGMSIVRRTVDIHRASIDLDSEEGKGTTITISFPIKKKKTIKALDSILT